MAFYKYLSLSSLGSEKILQGFLYNKMTMILTLLTINY